MELKDVLDKLGDDEQSVIVAAIEAEKNRGIEASRKKGVENNRLLGIIGKVKEHYAALGLDPESADIDAKINGLIESMKSKGGKETELQAALKRIERLELDVGSERKAKEEATSRFRRSRLTEELGKHLKGVVFGDDIVAENLISRGVVKIGDDDKAVFTVDGEDRPLEDGVSEYLKKRSDLLINKQAHGSSSSPSGSNPPKKVLPMSEFLKMSGKARSEFVKAGGVPKE